ncbi:slit homolog 1 protein-like isoform X2 [Dreissena polymorpha]|uniref:slit homolog 1 protein-like isoform X2 n=1 Tax=Dreissena polymorpha TaxID=45954 RepID=UPI0022645D42|nr:slit homolog 1 protein-like isoform X2 [Dreissena polymorpha]
MFADLRNLHTLDIGYNKLSYIGPRAFSNMPNLTDLRLTDQPTTTINIHADAFVGIENSLQHLLLSNIRFNYSTFWTILPSLTQLLELNLENTALTVIPDYAFRYNNKLTKLYLSNNKLNIVKQESFYGPKTTLAEVHLNGNQLNTLDACVFSDFSTKPMFFISFNKLDCDCRLLWLLSWIAQDRDPNTFVEVYIGPCISPQQFSNRYLNKDIKESELCPGGGGYLPQCPNLYTTTTVSTTTRTSSTTSPTTKTTLPPIPGFKLLFNHAGPTTIDVIWTVDDKTDVTGFKLELVTNTQGTISREIAASVNQYSFFDLQSGQYFYICLLLQIKYVLIDSPKSCISASTLYSVVVEGCTSPTQPPNLCTCQNTPSSNIKLLDCRFKNLTAIPSFTPTTEHTLFDLLLTSSEGNSTANRITTIGANAFQNIRVRKIELLGNKLQTVDNFAFNSSANIQEILIEGGGNNPAPFDALKAVRISLTMLHLKNFQQTTISSGQLAFTSLKTLILENINGLASLQPEAFNPLQNLTEFEILHPTGIWNTFPVPLFNNLRNLTHLKLQGLILGPSSTSIYAGSFHALSNLETLYIMDIRNLQSIDNGAFGNASKSLTHLYIRYTEISNLNFLQAEQWPSLELLDVSYNLKIGSVIRTTNFSTLSGLRYLLLADTGLTSVNAGMFADLMNLLTLDIGYNKISDIGPQAFSNMPHLTDLRLTDQPTTTINIHANAFVGIENSLQHLLLSNIRLNYSTVWTILPSLTQLLELNLENTALIVIPDYAFRYNNKLTKLYVSNNNLNMVKQESFYGPKTTLAEVHLNGNQLNTLDACVFSDFSTKPKFFISNNKLDCDCRLLWLLKWIAQDRDPNTFVEVYIGPCISPQQFSNRYLNKDIKEAELCPGGGGNLPECPNLYTTTTVSTTTRTSTTTPPTTTTTLPPIPGFKLLFNHAELTTIDVIWTVDDKTDVTGFKLQMVTNTQGTISREIAASVNQYRFFDLQPGQYYYICLHLQIKNVLIEAPNSCISASTLHPVVPSTTAQSTVKPEAQNLPVIIGASVGGVVLLVIIILIIFVLLKANKQKKQPPPTTTVSFTLHAHATIPQAGGTAKRFAKKTEKEGASPDDISVTMISNGEMVNKDRISAGSYQFLNEKGFDNRPMPSTSTSQRLPLTDKYNRPIQANGASPAGAEDHYMNNVDHRPLPKAPGGTKAYVNPGYKTSKEHLPETSKNEYNEVRY